VTDLADEYVALFNHGLSLDAPGCETCGGSIRAVGERCDGVPVAVIDIAHSNADCPTLAVARGIRRIGDVERLFVRHRYDDTARPLDEAAVAFFARTTA
jgi:hypothetical protein